MNSPQLRMRMGEEWQVGRRILTNLTREKLRRSYLDALDEEMKLLYCRRVREWPRPAYVTPDEARQKFESWDPPSSDDLSRNFLGALWLRGHWQKTGQTIHSETPNSHGNELDCWKYTGPCTDIERTWTAPVGGDR